MTERNRHPGGRPIHRPERKMLGFTRRPFDEPLTPGLRRHAPASAIGFTHDIVSVTIDPEDVSKLGRRPKREHEE